MIERRLSAQTGHEESPRRLAACDPKQTVVRRTTTAAMRTAVDITKVSSWITGGGSRTLATPPTTTMFRSRCGTGTFSLSPSPTSSETGASPGRRLLSESMQSPSSLSCALRSSVSSQRPATRSLHITPSLVSPRWAFDRSFGPREPRPSDGPGHAGELKFPYSRPRSPT
jgi:hypothetical protein